MGFLHPGMDEANTAGVADIGALDMGDGIAEQPGTVMLFLTRDALQKFACTVAGCPKLFRELVAQIPLDGFAVNGIRADW